MHVAPALMAASNTRYRNSVSLREASSAENSTFEQKDFAYFTMSMVCCSTSSGVILSLYCMCMGDVAMKVWMHGSTASFTAS